MKLTMSDRSAFVRAVMDDVPSEDYAAQARKLVQDYFVSILPPAVRAVYDDKELRHYLNGHEKYGFGVANGYYIGAAAEVRLPDELQAKLSDLGAIDSDQYQKRIALIAKLEAAIKACVTLKQAKERLPEFEKYLPADRGETGVKNLPAISNLVVDLTNAGWPKREEVVA